MTSTDDTLVITLATVEEIQQGWHDLKLRVGQLEVEHAALEQENKTLRSLLERVIEHRQKSHSELVFILSSLVSKLPGSDYGVIITKLVEHNEHVTEVCTALTKGKVEAGLPAPALFRALDQTKRDLAAAVKPAVEELIRLEPPLDAVMLNSLVVDPSLFFAPSVVRANRCFVKGQVPRERIVREFGEEALAFFNDMTTDPKLNPRPKPDDIVLSFKNDFEALLAQNTALAPEKRQQLQALHQRIQRSKAPTEKARELKNSFLKLSFILELLHYYLNQNTEASHVIFAQRLPVVIEHLAVTEPQDSLDEKLVLQAENLLAFIVNTDHRLTVVNNMGKAGGTGKTLKFILRLRAEKSLHDNPTILTEVLPEFIKHLVPVQKPPPPATLLPVLRFFNPDAQRVILRVLMNSDRIRRDQAEALGRAVAKELGVTGLDEAPKPILSPEAERQVAWDKVKELITDRADPSLIAAAIRERLHAKYDADEIRQSWLLLVEADAIALIRTVCQLPYLANGKSDPIARPVIETYVARLMHEKYAPAYHKVVASLKNMFKAKPDSPTLINFLTLVRWADPAAADKLSADIGILAPAH